jgi:hypothetical protein
MKTGGAGFSPLKNIELVKQNIQSQRVKFATDCSLNKAQLAV